jgi:hypothetical protein
VPHQLDERQDFLAAERRVNGLGDRFQDGLILGWRVGHGRVSGDFDRGQAVDGIAPQFVGKRGPHEESPHPLLHLTARTAVGINCCPGRTIACKMRQRHILQPEDVGNFEVRIQTAQFTAVGFHDTGGQVPPFLLPDERVDGVADGNVRALLGTTRRIVVLLVVAFEALRSGPGALFGRYPERLTEVEVAQVLPAVAALVLGVALVFAVGAMTGKDRNGSGAELFHFIGNTCFINSQIQYTVLPRDTRVSFPTSYQFPALSSRLRA